MQQEPNLDTGASNLLDVHINALGENSRKVVEILEKLAESKLTIKNKKDLKKIKSELKNIDKRFDSLDTKELNYTESQEFEDNEEEDWFAF